MDTLEFVNQMSSYLDNNDIESLMAKLMRPLITYWVIPSIRAHKEHDPNLFSNFTPAEIKQYYELCIETNMKILLSGRYNDRDYRRMRWNICTAIKDHVNFN